MPQITQMMPSLKKYIIHLCVLILCFGSTSFGAAPSIINPSFPLIEDEFKKWEQPQKGENNKDILNFLNLLEMLIEFSSQNSRYSFRSFSGILRENILSFGGIVKLYFYKVYINVYTAHKKNHLNN